MLPRFCSPRDGPPALPNKHHALVPLPAPVKAKCPPCQNNYRGSVLECMCSQQSVTFRKCEKNNMEPGPHGDKSQRAVSVYGPIFIGTNCLQLPVSGGHTEPEAPDESKRKSIDVSKYRIPTPKIRHRLTSTPDRFSCDPSILLNTTKQDRFPVAEPENRPEDIKPIVSKKRPNFENTEYDEIDSSARNVNADTLNGSVQFVHRTNGPKLKRFEDIGKFTGLLSNVSDLTSAANGDTNTPVATASCPSARKQYDTTFKISSTEDNYVLNKYKSRVCQTPEDSSVDINGNDKFSKIRAKLNQLHISKSSPKPASPGRDYFTKHRLKIAKLKRRFFESLPSKGNSNTSKSSPETDNKFGNGDGNAKEQQTNDCTKPTENEEKPIPNVDDTKTVPAPSEGFATESKATMQKKYGVGTKGRYRRYTSDGILGDRSVFSAGSQWAVDRAGHQAGLQDHVAVVAIDFGTTYSGYAYSFCHQPDRVHLMRRQEGGDPGVFDQKIPTTILLTPDGQFNSFGYAARDFYHDLDPRQATKWMYFDRFKMMLHNDGAISKDSKLRSVTGREISAMKVFSYSLAYFKDLVLQELSDQSALSISSDVIRWVITVPAIWKASAKQFMRQAAYEAGIVPNDRPGQLLIALEPEAASIYCRRLRMLHLTLDEEARASISDLTTRSSLSLPDLQNESLDVKTDDLDIGTQYMVVDCGGGTLDITVHELLDGGRLKELHRASGGSHGSVGIDEEFEKLLGAIFGIDIIEQFKRRRPSGWVDLLAVFESRKRTASPYRTSAISVSLPFSFIDFYKRSRGGSVESAVRRHGDPDVTWSSNGMLKLTPGIMRRLFLPTVAGIKQAIGDVLNKPDMHDLSYLFLVGGFAESSMVQHETRKDFGSLLKVIIPPGVSTSILKGAVYFGLDPYVVEERCSCMTYGVGVLHRFDAQKHPLTKLVSKDGIDWCTDIFDAFVKVNQPVALGDCIVRRYTPVRRDQTVTVIHVYSTERDDVEFVTDRDVTCCGTLTLKLDENFADNQSGGRREIRTEMMFGDTEIKVRATDVTTQLSVEASIDFMNF